MSYECAVTGKSYDPRKCARELFSVSDNKVNEWITVLDTKPDDYEVESKLVACVRKVFGLPDWDNDVYAGYTDQQVLDTLTQFNEYLAKKP